MNAGDEYFSKFRPDLDQLWSVDSLGFLKSSIVK